MIPTLFAAALAPLAMALGQTAIFFRQSLCELCIKVPATILGALYFGVAGAIAARAGSSLVTGIVSAAYVRSLIGVPLGVQLVRPWRAFAASAVMAALLLALRPWLQTLTGFDRGLGLVGAGAGGMMLYLVVLMLVWQASGRPRGIETVAADRFHRLVSRRTRGVA